MEYLIAGYESGALALFDMRTYKLVKIMKEIHYSQVLSAKIITVNEEKHQVETVSVEIGNGGIVSYAKFSTKGLFNSSKMEDLFVDRFKHPRSLAINRPDDRFKDTAWGRRQLMAVGATSEIVICQL